MACGECKASGPAPDLPLGQAQLSGFGPALLGLLGLAQGCLQSTGAFAERRPTVQALDLQRKQFELLRCSWGVRGSRNPAGH